ncbi:MAG: hypothetical protein ACRDGI_05560 [Candidatus Limnocylindrales bacterium]
MAIGQRGPSRSPGVCLYRAIVNATFQPAMPSVMPAAFVAACTSANDWA